jgi:hypothetical protein
MSPGEFTEALIIGMNLFVFGTFLAWRFLGPKRSQRPAAPAVTERSQSTEQIPSR